MIASRPLDYNQWGSDEPSEDCDGKPITTWYECEKGNDARGPEFNEYDPNVELTCPLGEIIEIKSALYGRANNEVCNKRGENWKDCPVNADVTAAAKQACDGQTKCNFHGDNSHAGDPCSGVQKYTEIRWKCVSPVKGDQNIL